MILPQLELKLGQAVVMRLHKYWFSHGSDMTVISFDFLIDPDRVMYDHKTTVRTIWIPELSKGGENAALPPGDFIQDIQHIRPIRGAGVDLLVRYSLKDQNNTPWKEFYWWYQDGRKNFIDMDKRQDAAIEEMEMIGAD